MRKQHNGSVTLVTLFILAGIVGWVLNLAQVFMSIPDTFASLAPIWVVKVVGVFVPPIGCVLGYIGLF